MMKFYRADLSDGSRRIVSIPDCFDSAEQRYLAESEAVRGFDQQYAPKVLAVELVGRDSLSLGRVVLR